MIAVAAVALDLAGLIYGPIEMRVLFLIATVFAPFVAFLAYMASKIGINALFADVASQESRMTRLPILRRGETAGTMRR